MATSDGGVGDWEGVYGPDIKYVFGTPKSELSELPEVGTICYVSGANSDYDKGWYYSARRVIAYTPCGNFIILQTRDCWPTVEHLRNCAFMSPENARTALLAARGRS